MSVVDELQRDEGAPAEEPQIWRPGMPWTAEVRERMRTRAKPGEKIRRVPTEAGPRRERSRGAAGAPSKGQIKAAIESANALFIMTGSLVGLAKYALTEEEIEAETDALYLLSMDTPQIGRALIKGNRFTVWGKFAWVQYVILARRGLVPDAGGLVTRAPAGSASTEEPTIEPAG